MTDWQEVKLGDICDVRDGTHDTPKESSEGKYLVTSKHIKGGKIDLSSAYKISLEDFNFVNQRSKVDQWDILISMIGTVGEICLVSEYPDFAIKNVGLIKTGNEYLAKYLYYYLKSPVAQNDILSRLRGTTQQYLPLGEIRDFPVYLPSLDMQKQIAGVLGALDDKIELNNKINNNLEQQAQELFKSIYRSENNGTLSDIVDLTESGSRPKGGALDHGVPSIGAENIEKFGIYDYSKEKFISKEFYDQMKRGKVLSGDVLLYKDGAYTGKVSLALDGFPHKSCAVNEHVFIIRGKPGISSQFFIYFCLDYEQNKNYLHTLACSKAAQPGLNQSELLGLPIFIPSSDIVKIFTNNVSPLMHKIAANALENIKLSQLRDTLLPKLMSGEIDVSEVNISADKSSFREKE